MDSLLRFGVAAAIFMLMITWEALRPRRSPICRKSRWPVNLGLALSNIVIMKLTLGGLAWISAGIAVEQGWGLLNQFSLPHWIDIAVTLLLLDAAIYLQHVLSHRWSWLWRLHQVHHSDYAIDATTAVRFHPVEIVLSMLYKSACVMLIGADPAAVILFEIILNGAATFNHSNISIPQSMDRVLRWFIVTPDMHRIHHSVIRSEMDSNYGFSISLWDRLFRTYTDFPHQSHTRMAIGLSGFPLSDQSLLSLLKLPLKKLTPRSD